VSLKFGAVFVVLVLLGCLGASDITSTVLTALTLLLPVGTVLACSQPVQLGTVTTVGMLAVVVVATAVAVVVVSITVIDCNVCDFTGGTSVSAATTARLTFGMLIKRCGTDVCEE